ncbi:hypothetical protein KR222_011883 [Zaprionus bogoriensis]|nr:hypothetical protein KR222_011883 [Zaprionus bogoriensis]
MKPKWQSLKHNGPLFPDAYERLPSDVKFYYNDCAIELTEQAEEVATFYAKLLNTSHVQLPEFNANFFSNFSSCLSCDQRLYITKFELCDFVQIHEYLKWQKSLESISRTARAKEREDHYGYCFVDGVRRRVKLFRIRAPGLCYSLPNRSNSLVMGMIRPRVLPEDVTINCGEYDEPPKPPLGHSWMRVQHDHSVTWLYSWVDLFSGQTHYARPQSLGYRTPQRVKMETARRLQQHLGKIRNAYRQCWRSDQWLDRQLSVAMYCIDRLAMSTDGQGEQARTALCSLRVQHLMIKPRGSDRTPLLYMQRASGEKFALPIHPEILYNLTLFMAGKKPEDLVFEELTAGLLDDHLGRLMDGLTAQIFRICNASRMLQQRLDILSADRQPLHKQLQGYNRVLKHILSWCSLRRVTLPHNSSARRSSRSRVQRVSAEQRRMELIGLQTRYLVQATFPYLDPRITIAWCQRCNIPIHFICKSSNLRSNLNWALSSTTKDFRF